MSELLPADSAMGAVTLRVADLDAMTRYYRDAVTLSVLAAEGDRVILGRGATPAVILEHAPALYSCVLKLPSRALASAGALWRVKICTTPPMASEPYWAL